MTDEVPRIFLSLTPTAWGLLKQPDKQKIASILTPGFAGVWSQLHCPPERFPRTWAVGFKKEPDQTQRNVSLGQARVELELP